MDILHDLHIHTTLSVCCKDKVNTTVVNYIEEANNLGLKTLGFSDHLWDECVPLPSDKLHAGWAYNFYQTQTMKRQMAIHDTVPKDTKGVRVLVGGETEYCGMFDLLGMTKEGAKQLDYLLIPHTHVHMRNFVMKQMSDYDRARENFAAELSALGKLSNDRIENIIWSLSESELDPFRSGVESDCIQYISDFMVESFRSLLKNESLLSFCQDLPVIVAHPFQPVGATGREEMLALISDETFGDLFQEAAKLGIGLEINAWTDYDQVKRMFRIAKECGCKFTFGSDAHQIPELCRVLKAKSCADAIGLTEENLMDFIRS